MKIPWKHLEILLFLEKSLMLFERDCNGLDLWWTNVSIKSKYVEIQYQKE